MVNCNKPFNSSVKTAYRHPLELSHRTLRAVGIHIRIELLLDLVVNTLAVLELIVIAEIDHGVIIVREIRCEAFIVLRKCSVLIRCDVKLPFTQILRKVRRIPGTGQPCENNAAYCS